MASSSRGKKQRPHQPNQLGPRLFRSPAGFIGADFRYLDRGRLVLRNPAGTGWHPEAKTGEATRSEEVAREWVTDYLRSFRRTDRDRQLNPGTGRSGLSLQDEKIRYLTERELVDRVAKQTLYNDAGALALLADWFGWDVLPDAIGKAELEAKFKSRLRDGMAYSSLRTVRAHLSRFFDFLEIEPNPARAIKLKGEKSAKKNGWSTEQIIRLREAADRIDARGELRISARFALELALGTGAREGELFGLEAKHVNERDRSVRVVQQVSIHHSGLVETKGRDVRTAIILPDYWAHHRPGASGLLLSIDGAPIRQARERSVIDDIIREADMKVFGERTHMTRHTYSRLFLEEFAGDLRDLQKFLGHKSLRTTEEYYGHYSLDVAIERAQVRIYGAQRKLAAS